MHHFDIPSFSCCGGLTRTDDLWVMSPTSYQLLHSAMLFFLNCAAKVRLFSEKTNFYAIFFHRMSRHQSRGGDQWHIEKNVMLNERAVIGCHFYKKRMNGLQAVHSCQQSLFI